MIDMRRIESDLLQLAFSELTNPAVVASCSTSKDDEDLLPEYCHYKDEGCEFASSCLECPFPECVEDQPYGSQKRLKEQRNAEIVRLYFNEKKTYRELSSQFGLTSRTLRRIICGGCKKL